VGFARPDRWSRARPAEHARPWHAVEAHRPPAELDGEVELVPGQATFASLMVEARLMTLRSLGSVACRFRQAM
jgi:hypothetical protein